MQALRSLGTLVLQLLPIIVFFIAGAVMRRQLLRQWQGDRLRLRAFQRGLNMVLVEVLLPAIAFLSMARLPLNLGWRLAWVPVVGIVVALLALALNHLLLALPLLRPPGEQERRALDMLAPWSNTVIVGLPTIATLLGPDVLYVPFLETSFIWTLILGPLIIHRVRAWSAVWDGIQPLLRSLWFWAIPVGLAWAILELPLGGVALLTLERAREAFLVLGLLIVGLGFDPALLRPQQTARLPLAAIAESGSIKLLVCPLLALLLARWLALPPAIASALALAVATPSSLTAYIISEREGVDPEFMSFVFALYSVVFFGSVLVVQAVLPRV